MTSEERKQVNMNAKREQFLERIKKHLQTTINICDSAENYFSDHYQKPFLDFDLKNSLECAMEDVEFAADNG